MTYLLALDQGTTSSRAIVFDHTGSLIAVSQKEFPQLYPKPGWVEHNPNDIWETQASVAIDVLVKAGIGAADVVATGIANQRETTLVWDRRTGQPVCNAIVWARSPDGWLMRPAQRAGPGIDDSSKNGPGH